MDNADVSVFPVAEKPLGLTKREFFAAMVLQGLVNPDDFRSIADTEARVEAAIRHADALIAELAKGKPNAV